MKWWQRLAVMSLLVGYIVGCSKSAADEGTAPSRVPPVSDAVRGNEGDQSLFLHTARGFGLDYDGYTNDELLRLGELACRYFAGGADVTWVFRYEEPIIADFGGTSDDLLTILSSAALNLCPAYVDKVRHATKN